jgi:hypothetical protein
MTPVNQVRVVPVAPKPKKRGRLLKSGLYKRSMNALRIRGFV